MFGVIVLLLTQGVVGIVVSISPEYVNLYFERNSLTDMWQCNYGVPGKEQYTVAIDLVQVKVIH